MTNEKPGIFAKIMHFQEGIEARGQRFGKGKYGRVLKMASKPTNDEYEKTAKITGAGILAIGGLGFIIYIIKQLVVPWILGFFGS